MQQLVSVLNDEHVRYYVADDDGTLTQIAQIALSRQFTPEAAATLGLNLIAATGLNGVRTRARTVSMQNASPRVEQPVEQLPARTRRQIEPPPRAARAGKPLHPDIMKRLLDAIAQLPPEGMGTDEIGALISMRDRVRERLRALERAYAHGTVSAPFELIRRPGPQTTLVVPREQRGQRPSGQTQPVTRYDWPDDERVVSYVREHPGCTFVEIGKALGVSVDDNRTLGAWRYRLVHHAGIVEHVVTRTTGIGPKRIARLYPSEARR